MKFPSPSPSLHDLRQLTPGRVALGRTGASLPTQALLEFSLDHARARGAVRVSFDAPAIASQLEAMGLEALSVCSQVDDRDDYLRRPDRGRKLSGPSRDL